MKTMVAVYGSLLSGLGNHGFLSGGSSILVGEGRANGLDLYPYAGTSFPAACLAEDDRSIKVEVYNVDDRTMASLDMLEGFPAFYNRRLTTVRLEDGSKVQAWVYFLKEDSASRGGQLKRIEHGDWRRYRMEVRYE